MGQPSMETRVAALEAEKALLEERLALASTAGPNISARAGLEAWACRI